MTPLRQPRRGLAAAIAWASAWTVAMATTLAASDLRAQDAGRVLVERREIAMGMEVRITAAATPASRDRAEDAIARAFARIDALEDVLSDWRPASELSLLADRRVGEAVPVSGELMAVLQVALDIARATDGAFDPTVGAITRLWREAQRTGVPVDEGARAVARASVDWRAVVLDTVARTVAFRKPGLHLDLGGIAKGWIAEQAMLVLERAGVTDALIEAGGEIVTRGAPPGQEGWRIVVETARGDTTLMLRDAAVSTSQSGAQLAPSGAGGHEGHVIRPSTGRGETGTPRVTVVGADATVTDALATALSLLPHSRWAALLERYAVQVVR
ncbi:MAG: FAD:protein FMN transferase [Gemmatimonadaceae bacterium]|nr:FAD:protein FMN transferase [Gemmatimonadaceae bacterium]